MQIDIYNRTNTKKQKKGIKNMKILVRENNDGACNYVWKKLNNTNPYLGSSQFMAEDGQRYSSMDILKINGDYRNGNTRYVKCCGCGKIIKDTPEAIENHYIDQETNIDCLKCSCIYLSQINSVPEKLILKADGTVVRKTTNKALCRMTGYYSPKETIQEVDKQRYCIHYNCRRNGMASLREDVWSRYPNPFKKILTEKKIIKEGWKMISKMYGRIYESKNGKLRAMFDENGILDFFVFKYRNDTFRFRYSDVYDEFLDENGIFGWNDIAITSAEKYRKQIRALYR